MMKRKKTDDLQLSLFDQQPAPPEEVQSTTGAKPTTVYEFIRARLDREPEMSQEEYKRWIKILVEASIKRMNP